MSEQYGIPEDRREAALVYYSLIRAYWRLADAACLGTVNDIDRGIIEPETLEVLPGAGEVVEELGPHSEKLVASAQEALQRISTRLGAGRKATDIRERSISEKEGGIISATPPEIEAMIARGVCTLSFVAGTSKEKE